MDKIMYNLSRIYGYFGMKAQKYSLVNPQALPGRLRVLWHAYRILLMLILVFALLLFFQNVKIFWCAFAAGVVSLYIKGILEEKLDRGLLEIHVQERTDARDAAETPE